MRHLIAFMFMCSLAAHAETITGNKYAVVVGVAQYQDSALNLQAASRDATELAAFLRSQQALGGYDDVQLLTDAGASRKEIFKAIKHLAERAGPNDNVLFFFSGHGFPGPGGHIYIAPHDVDREVLEDTGCNLTDIRNKLENLTVRQRIMLVDCCHSGGVVFKDSKAVAEPTLSRDLFEKLSAEGKGTVVLTASTGEQLAWEDTGPEGSGMGFFTKYLLKGLRGEADGPYQGGRGNGDGHIDIDELSKFVYYRVNDEVLKKHGKPQQASKLGKTFGEVILSVVDPAVLAPPSTPPPEHHFVNTTLPGSKEFEEALKYDRGMGVPRNIERAARLYRKAADLGNADAQFALAQCYEFGWGVRKDIGWAVTWYQKAAAQAHASAQYELSGCYWNGQGVDKDEDEGLRFLQLAAEAGHSKAQFVLGQCYEKGRRVTVDMASAARWYEKAAEQGFGPAMYELGGCYWNGAGVAKDPAKGLEWIEKAAEQGHEKAARALPAMRARAGR